MKKYIWVTLVLISSLIMVFAITSPVLACALGKSPGYWKNHPGAWPSIYDPSKIDGTTIDEAFGFNPGDNYHNMTLMAALRTKRNSDGKAAFWRQAIATLLNQGTNAGEIAFLGRLVPNIYPDGGIFVDPGGWGTFGASTWTLEDWKNWFEWRNCY
ncbi:MAG TPA: hypothetical protein G4O12_01350 [Dehalococcoidia bacterium]|nr:hypothetical protein [Dehalococcoidia bacterium]